MTDTTQAPPAMPVVVQPVTVPAADYVSALEARLAALETQLAPKQGWTVWAASAVSRTSAAAWRAVSGLKSVIFFGIAGLASLADAFGAVDLTPYIDMFLPAGAHITTAQAVALMSLAGLFLRFLTHSSLFISHFRADDGK